MLTIRKAPYNPAIWVSRAYLFYQQGRLDLALGDVWRAVYLATTISDDDRKSESPGRFQRVWDALEEHVQAEIFAARTFDRTAPREQWADMDHVNRLEE